VTNTPLVSLKKPESISTSTSVVPYQTLSSIYNDSTTVVPKSDSTQTLLPTINVISSNLNRDDNNVKKKET